MSLRVIMTSHFTIDFDQLGPHWVRSGAAARRRKPRAVIRDFDGRRSIGKFYAFSEAYRLELDM